MTLKAKLQLLTGLDGEGQIRMPNNTYKGLRIVHEDYDLYYSAWCNNEHELYDVKVRFP